MVGVPWRWKGWGFTQREKGGKNKHPVFWKIKMDILCFFFQRFLHPPKYMKGWIWLDIIVFFHSFFIHVPTCLKLKLLPSSPSFLSFLVWWGGDHNYTKKLGPGVFIVVFFAKHLWSDIRYISDSQKKKTTIVFTMNLLFVPIWAETLPHCPWCDPSNP